MLESKIPQLKSIDCRVAVGRFTYGSPEFKLWTEIERIEIGSFCSIAEGVVIFGGGEHHPEWVTTFPLRIAMGDPLAGKDGHPTTKGITKIGNDVWIGYEATILSGVTIGDGAIIGARAVVAKDIPPYHIAIGNPAKVLKSRFNKEQIRALCNIRWWDWPLERIEKYAHLLCGSDVDAFIQNTTYYQMDSSKGCHYEQSPK